jgi:hypothetical protein
MSGGQKIKDFGGYPHTSEMAMKSKNSLKTFTSAEGAGAENDYEDTTEAIRKSQVENASKAKARPLKSGFRN